MIILALIPIGMKRIFPLPRLIQWMLWTGLIFLAMLTLMRIGFFNFFNQQGYTFSSIGDALFLGLRFDLRVVAIILLCMLVIGNIPLLHPFRTQTGKRFWLALLGMVSLVMVVVYTIDFAHYSYLSQRLNASVLSYLHDFRISLGMVWESYPVLWLILGILLLTALLIWLLRLTHARTTRTKAVPARNHAILSFIFSFIVLGLVIFGKAGQYPLRWSDAFSLGSDYKANLALNPF